MHTKVSDKGSNMVKGWSGFEGGVCAMHTGERSVAIYVEHPQVGSVCVSRCFDYHDVSFV